LILTAGLADDSTDLTVLNINEETILNMGLLIFICYLPCFDG